MSLLQFQENEILWEWANKFDKTHLRKMQEARLQVHLGSDKEHNSEQDQVLDHPELTTPSPKRLPQLAERKS